VARYLGPTKFGILNFALSFVGLFSAFAKMGLDGIIVKAIIQNPDKKDEILGSSLLIRLLGSIFLIVATLISLQLTSTNNHEKLIVLIIAFNQLFLSFEIFDFYFQSQVQAKFSGIANLFALISYSLLRILLIIFNFELIWFAISVIFEQVIKAVILIIFYKNKLINTSSSTTLAKIGLNLKCKKKQIKLLLQNSWPMLISGLAVSFYMKIDQVMVKEMISNEANGYYSVAVKLSEVWLFISLAITQSLLPATLNSKKTSSKLYLYRLESLYKLLFIISVFISTLVYFCSNIFIDVLYGTSYLPTSNILKIYVWSTIFVFFNNGSWHFYLAENLQKLAAIRLTIGAILNIVCNFFLINYFGIKGAAIATLISYCFAGYFGNLLFKETRLNFKLQTLAIKNAFSYRSYLK
jgi:O-antigen/teichoic acid export membrane protein